MTPNAGIVERPLESAERLAELPASHHFIGCLQLFL